MDGKLTVIDAKLDEKLTLLRQYFTHRYYDLHQAVKLHLKIYPKSVHLPTYEIGAVANPAHFASVITEKIKILKIKELKLNNAAFIL